MAEQYSEIILRFRPSPEGAGTFAAEAIVDGLGFWSGGKIDLSASKLDETAEPGEYGRQLWSQLTSGWDELKSILTPLKRGNQKVRLRLMLDPASIDLHRVKWEFLTPPDDSAEPIGVNPFIAVSRFIPLPSLPNLSEAPGLKILLAIANPSNLKEPLAPINAEAEIASFLDSLHQHIRDGQVELTVLPGSGTKLSEDLTGRLQQLKCKVLNDRTTDGKIAEHLAGHHVLHLIAHGGFDSKEDKPFLVLEDENGKSVNPKEDPVTKWRADQLRLVFLQSCQSDAENAVRFAAALGPAFVNKNVPAVVAMRDFVEMGAARKFAAGFYRCLLDTGEVDVAVNAGRRETYKRKTGDWAIPVLYSRLRSGQQLWTPDPIRASVRDLRDKLLEDKEVLQPFPVEVSVVKNVEAVQRELDNPVSRARVDALATAKAELESKAEQSKLVVLIGERGRAKSSFLRKLFVDLATTSAPDPGSFTPLLIRLNDCASNIDPNSAVLEAWRKALTERWVPLDRQVTGKNLETRPLNLLVDGGDDFGSDQSKEALERVKKFLSGGNARFGILTMDQSAFDPNLFDRDQTTVLLVKDLGAATLRSYLEKQPDLKDNSEVVAELAGPFAEFAGVPCLLRRILDLVAHHPEMIRSRFLIVERVVSENLAQLSVTPGSRFLAKAALCEMAWRLHCRQGHHLSLPETYSLLIDARGSRDFHLDAFRSGLLSCGILTASGPEGVRFTYASVHAYFTACYLNSLAESELRDKLGEIVAGLRSMDRLQMWQEVLLLLAGHMASPDVLLGLLMDLAFGEGEHILLAARCLHEARCAGRAVDQTLVDLVKDSLVWWSSPGSGLRVSSRRRAVKAFEFLLSQPQAGEGVRSDDFTKGREAIICHLLQLAFKPIRSDAARRQQLDFSGVRLEAMTLLFKAPQLGELQRFCPVFTQLSAGEIQSVISTWSKPDPDLDALSRFLNYDEVEGEHTAQSDLLAGLAAFRLVTLGSSPCKEHAINLIIERFLRPPINEDLHWLITDAMVSLQATEAGELVAQAVQYEQMNATLAHHIVYAIGRLGNTLGIGSQYIDGPIFEYLKRQLQSVDTVLQRLTLRASAEVLGTTLCPEADNLRDLCHQILQDQHQNSPCLWGEGKAGNLDTRNSLELKRYAIQSLEHVGNLDTLEVLRNFCLKPADGTATSEMENLRKLSWSASETIRLRDPRFRANAKASVKNEGTKAKTAYAASSSS